MTQTLIQVIEQLVEAAKMSVEMIETEKHERRYVRWALKDAIHNAEVALASQQEDPQLEALQTQFEQQLSVLHEPGAHEKLQQIGKEPLQLPNPVTVDGKVADFTVRIGGKPFFCDCGCNVFHKPDDENLHLYQCNACGTQYQ